MNGQQQQQQFKPLPPIPRTQKPKGKGKGHQGGKNRNPSQQSSVKTVSIPASQGTIRRARDPQFASGGRNGDIIVTHEEYVGDVNGSISFNASKYAVNPGLSGTYPWLAAIAPNYESYKFESLEFEFRTTTNNQATGNVALFLDYDPADPAPANKREILNSESTMDGPAWSISICQRSKRENLNKRTTYLVRQGAVSGTSSLTLYDVGNLFVCTQGQAGATVIGELFCRYRVRLMTPQMGISGVGNSLSGLISGTTLTGPLTVTGNLPVTVTGNPTAAVLTATAPLQCLVAIAVTGTTIVGLTGSGSALVTTETDVVDNTSTHRAQELIVNFVNVGDSLTVSLAAATSSAYAIRIGQYLYSLG